MEGHKEILRENESAEQIFRIIDLLRANGQDLNSYFEDVVNRLNAGQDIDSAINAYFQAKTVRNTDYE